MEHADAFARVLRLAAEGAGEAAMETALREAGLSGAAVATAQELARRSRSASRSRDLVRVLYDIATDLAAIRDVEAVLLAIVQRTRAITGADMAYLSLNDHASGETYIRKSDGVRTEEYRTIRMPLGTGVLGKAATGMSVVSTSDYLDDPSLVHLGDIDRIVALEGVRSILGVPMNVHGRIQGALLIADRRAVQYSPETLSTVDAIARQAAVAIDYSARLAQVTDALAALDAQHDAGTARVRALQELLDLDRQMVEAVARRGGPDAILALLNEIYGAPAELIGPEGAPEDQLLDNVLRSAAAAGRSVPAATADGPATVAAAEVGEQRLGYVVVRAAIPVENRDVLEHAALYVAVSALMDRIEADVERRSQHELLDDLIRAGDSGAGALHARLTQAGLHPRRPLAMLVIGTELPVDDAARVLRAALPSSVIGVHEGHICALHQGDPAGEQAHAALRRAGVTSLVGSAAVQELNVARAHRSAQIALASLRLLGGTVLDGDQLGALGALLEADEQGRLPRSVTAPAEPLLAAPRGEELARTAWALLEFGPRIPAVAKRLYIHPNTLRQRMQRIASLLGDDWCTGPGRLDLHLALRAVMMRTQAP